LQMFVCERHAGNVACVERALFESGEFPDGATLVSTSTQALSAINFLPNRLATATAE
jgi:hypothetical protein